MASVLNRTTKQYLQSVNTPEYPSIDWIVEPNLSAVVGFPSQYWTITGDTVTLMTLSERNAVDAALLGAARDALVATYDDVETEFRSLVLVLLDELNAHAAKINAIMTAVDNGGSYGAFKTAIAAIVDYPTRTIAQIKTAIRGKLGT